MDTQRRIFSIAICSLLLASTSAARFAATDSNSSRLTQGGGEPEACTLLTTADASKAIELSSAPGQRMVEADPKGCLWSSSPAAMDTSRRVALVLVSPRQFQIAMHPAITTIKVEPASGIGDEAFYQLYPNASPFLWVRKGNKAVSLRIMTKVKPSPPFTVDQEKSKLAVLGKTVIAKL